MTAHFSVPDSLFNCRQFQIGNIPVGGGAPLVLIAGPCVIESPEQVHKVAAELVTICKRLSLPLVFKASYDKANRTAGDAFRGPGIEEGLRVLAGIQREFGTPLLTDVHKEHEAAIAAEVCDILQIPAFLCRQTDFVEAVGRAGKPVNIKKGQFLAPADVRNVVAKLREVGCEDILLTERGASFGYGTLVSDFRSPAIMQQLTGLPTCFDATHSVQQPGGLGSATGGQREFVPLLARAACGAGINALFVETHYDPSVAKSDGPNMVPLHELEDMLAGCLAVDRALRSWAALAKHA